MQSNNSEDLEMGGENMASKRYPPMLKLTLKRKEARMTICELAERVGLNYNTISQYENGRHIPRLENIKKIAEVLGCDIKEIV